MRGDHRTEKCPAPLKHFMDIRIHVRNTTQSSTAHRFGMTSTRNASNRRQTVAAAALEIC